jgi:hypothetical protein
MGNLQESINKMKHLIGENWKQETSFPAVDFSKKTGIVVYTDWELPFPWNNNAHLHEFLRNNNNEEHKDLVRNVENVWKYFLDKYPQIESWIPGGLTGNKLARAKWDIMFGMASKFNEDDIKSYLYRKGGDASANDKKRVSNIESKTGAWIGWVPSDKTLHKIETLLQ